MTGLLLMAASAGWILGRVLRPVPPWRIVAVATALAGAVFFAAAAVGWVLVGPPGQRLLAPAVGLQAAQLAVIAWAASGGRELGLALPAARAWLGALAVGALGIGSSLLWSFGLDLAGFDPGPQAVLRELFGASPAEQAWMALLLAGIAPLLEELLFRGFALPLAVESLGRRAGPVLLALAFTLFHAHAPQALPPILVLALGLGELRLRSGSVWPCVLAHALNNALAT